MIEAGVSRTVFGAFCAVLRGTNASMILMVCALSRSVLIEIQVWPCRLQVGITSIRHQPGPEQSRNASTVDKAIRELTVC